MAKIVGVRFRNGGKVYHFDPLDYEIEAGNHVIVETARGVEYGTVVIAPREAPGNGAASPLKPIIRMATPEDDQTIERNREREKSAYQICQEKIAKHGLAMKLVQAEYAFDNSKLLFYFTADGRVDFRELVKDLAGVFRMRIELRQIGVRDEAKMLGGIGICGREFCCRSYLSDFVPVSIKMAKEQNLSLNPAKISGACGRLMCCLKNEEDTYEYLNSRLPAIGDKVYVPEGAAGEVQSVNVLRQRVKVLVEADDEKELHEYDVDELRFHSRKKNKFSDEDKELSGEPEESETPDDPAPEQSGRDKRGSENRNQNRNRNRATYHGNAQDSAETGEKRQQRRHYNKYRGPYHEKDGTERSRSQRGGLDGDVQ